MVGGMCLCYTIIMNRVVLWLIPYVGVLLLFSCDGNQPRTYTPPKPETVERGEDHEALVSLLLNSPLENSKPSSGTESEIGRTLLDVVSGAQETLDVAAYGLRNQPEILEALRAAEVRGVRVRIVYDQDAGGESYYSDTPLLAEIGTSRNDYEADLHTASIASSYDGRPMWPAPNEFKGPPQCVGYTIAEGRAVVAVHASREELSFNGDIMHNKFVIADRTLVWTGSCNLSDSGTGGYNANAALLVRSPQVAKWYTEEFDRLFSGQFHRTKTDAFPPCRRELVMGPQRNLVLGFSPQDYCFENLVEPALREAQDSIDVGIFYLTHKRVTGELIRAHRRGVAVRVIVDATSAGNGYTKHELLRVAGIPVKVENWGGKMHMKCALIDDRKLIIGSMNWTSAGENKNDENTIIVRNEEIGAEFGALYERMWASIPERWLKDRPDPESRDSTGSDRDGIDNDFDSLVDGRDPGCGSDPPPLPPLPPHRIVPLADGYDLIKGNISSSGARIYHLPGSKYYDKTRINERDGERWFPSVIEAREAGWRGSRAR